MRIVIAGYHMPKIHLPRIHIVGDDESRSAKHKRESYYGDSPIAHVMEKIDNKPHTWAAHMGKPDGMMQIVEMEYKELMEKKASGSKSDILKELEELAAACIVALERMKDM